MTSFDVDAITLASLRDRRSAKYRVYDDDVLPAWVAEMDFPLAEPIADALHAAVDRSDAGYRWTGGLGEALSGFADRVWGWHVPPERVLAVPDILAGLAESLRVLTSPGDGVVINPPIYPPFFSTIRDVARRTIVEVPLCRLSDGSYGYDLPALEAAFARPEVSAYVLCNPHNPTGIVASRAVLESIAELAAQHEVLVVADEVHGPLVLPGADHVPYLSQVADDANAIALVSASKAWNIAGLKCAQVVGTRRTSAELEERLPLEVTYGTGSLGVIAAIAAYERGLDWLADVRQIVDGNRHELSNLLARRLPLAAYVPPQASYLAWIDFSGHGLGDDPAAVLLESGRVALSSGPTFGPGGEGFARLNIGTSPALLAEAVERMARAIVVQ